MTHVDPKAQAAVQALLVETWKTLERHNVGGIVVGGWVAKLFNGSVPHPGTLDVDILVPHASLQVEFQSALTELLCNGFLPNGKNSYQVAKVYDVNGKPVLFHVDFLCNENESDTAFFERGDGTVHSIYTPSMELAFDGNLRTLSVEGEWLRFPSAAVFLATKVAALGSQKRIRDPFDIFATLNDSEQRNEVVAEFQRRHSHPYFSKALADLEGALASGSFLGRACDVLEQVAPGQFSRSQVGSIVGEFIHEVKAGVSSEQ